MVFLHPPSFPLQPVFGVCRQALLTGLSRLKSHMP